MAVTNLTGYTWVGNNSIDLTAISFNATFNFTFNSGVDSFIGFRFYDPSADEDYNTLLSYEGSNGFGAFYYHSNMWYYDWAKTIQITGGTDATNSTLIAWLEANGTLTPPEPELGYEVTFVTNGGTSVTKLEDVEELPTPLPTTTKSNNIFVGWFYDSEFEEQAYSGDELTANVTLYAKWYANMEDFYEDVADAIRSKNGETEPIKHTDFAYKIKNIQGVKELTQAQYDALPVYDDNTYYLIVEDLIVEEDSPGGYAVTFSIGDTGTSANLYYQFFSIDNGTTWTQLTLSWGQLLVDTLNDVNMIKFKIRNARIEIDGIVFANRINDDGEFVTDNYTLTKDVDIYVEVGWFD